MHYLGGLLTGADTVNVSAAPQSTQAGHRPSSKRFRGLPELPQHLGLEEAGLETFGLEIPGSRVAMLRRGAAFALDTGAALQRSAMVRWSPRLRAPRANRACLLLLVRAYQQPPCHVGEVERDNALDEARRSVLAMSKPLSNVSIARW